MRQRGSLMGQKRRSAATARRRRELRRDVVVGGDILVPLVDLRMSGLEWRVIVTVLLLPEPVSAKWIAVRLQRPYGPVKRVIRGLIGWRILRRTASGISFRPDRSGWGPPRPPSSVKDALSGEPKVNA
jgi:hypothetical protein